MIHYNKPASDYHSGPGISKSGLDKIAISPAHYKASIDRPQAATEELYIGQATHTLTLEPEKFDDEFVIAPPGLDRRTKEGRAAAEQMAASGKQVLTYQQYELVQGMAVSVRSNQTALNYIMGGHAEVSFDAIWDGVLVRGRCDYLRDDGVVADLKTTRSAHPKSFTKSISDYRYHVQAAIYSDLLADNGIFVPEFVFIAVEKFYPFAVGIYTIDEAGIDRGRQIYERDLAIYKHCSELGEWPGYPEEVVQLTLPPWA